MLGEFARFILKHLDDEAATAKRLRYVSEVYERGSEQINYFIWVNMFEEWTWNAAVRPTIQANLYGRAQAAFQEATQAYDAQRR